MESKGRQEEEKEKAEKVAKVPKKKRKTEPEVTIAPTRPGGPDISVE
jgi:hypothetical protein